jgi:hypothetical protein
MHPPNNSERLQQSHRPAKRPAQLNDETTRYQERTFAVFVFYFGFDLDYPLLQHELSSLRLEFIKTETS